MAKIAVEGKIPEEYEEKSKETLSKPKERKSLGFENVKPSDPLLQAFRNEATEELSKKRKKELRRKTRAKGA